MLLQWPPSSESPHHPFLRLQEKSAFSLGLQPGRARAPWRESCDFLNEWHLLLYRILAFLFLSCIVCFMRDLYQAQPFFFGCGKNFFFFFKRLEFKHPERFILCNDGPTPPPPPTNTTQIMFRAVGLLWAGGRAGALEGGVGLRGLDAAGYKIDL